MSAVDSELSPEVVERLEALTKVSLASWFDRSRTHENNSEVGESKPRFTTEREMGEEHWTIEINL